MFHTGFTQLPKVRDYRDTLTYDKVKYARFVTEMHERGVRLIGRGLWYVSAAHTDAETQTWTKRWRRQETCCVSYDISDVIPARVKFRRRRLRQGKSCRRGDVFRRCSTGGLSSYQL